MRTALAPAKQAKQADYDKWGGGFELARPPAALHDRAPGEAPVGRVARYHRDLAQHRDTLVGYVMELGYDCGVIVTNDYYKVRVGGLPKNSFLLIRPGSLKDLIRPDADPAGPAPELAAAVADGLADGDDLFAMARRPASVRVPSAQAAPGTSATQDLPAHLILARVLEATATPLSQDVARVYFEMRKSHAPEIDVFTRSELQWGAMKVAVLGTFYDQHDPSGGRAPMLRFGGDVQNFLSPHMYSAHVPTPQMLQELINAFVDGRSRRQIGSIRLAESLLSARGTTSPDVAVFVSPTDFIGSRTALFGKTRMGKSNTVKLIARMVLDCGRDTPVELANVANVSKAAKATTVGQIIFDLNGEYAYRNEQDRTCLYDLYAERCVRYSLRPEPPAGVRPLKADFYADVRLGHRIIRELFRQQEGSPPDYMKGFFEWEPLTSVEASALEKEDREAFTRYQRQEAMYRCILHEAGFDHGPHSPSSVVRLNLNQDVRADLADRLTGLAETEKDGTLRIPPALPLDGASAAYQTLWQGYDPTLPLFRTKSGREYLDETAKSMLTILGKCRVGGGAFVSGHTKLAPFRRYHSREGGRLLREIVDAVDAAKTVIIDLSNAAEELVEFFGGMVCNSVFQRQMEKFTADALGSHYVQFYFEEAHNLFPRDDRNLRNIYNRLAKEGAKLNIGIVYSTQSIESLSPDLLKNTENFFIAHLNDEREVKALTRFHEFRDVGADVQRTKTHGFVRMITKSHRFALPVQIRKFAAEG